MNTLANLISFYNSGEDNIYHFVLGQILSDSDLFLRSSIYEIADRYATSTATISRLAQKLGYKNFTDFRHNLFDAFHYYRYSNQVIPAETRLSQDALHDSYFSSLQGILNQVNGAVMDQTLLAAAQMLHEARRVRIFSFNTGFTDTALQINLLMDGKESLRCDRFMDQLTAAKKLSEEDAVLIMAPDCSDALDIIPLTQIILDRGAKWILITNSTNSVHSKRADLTIAFDGTNSNLDLWGMYMIVDLINLKYRNLYIE